MGLNLCVRSAPMQDGQNDTAQDQHTKELMMQFREDRPAQYVA